MIGHDAVGQDVQAAELGVGDHPVDELFLFVGTEDEPAVHHSRDAVVVRLADSRIELQTGLAHARKVDGKSKHVNTYDLALYLDSRKGRALARP